jgi:hypothetical protein
MKALFLMSSLSSALLPLNRTSGLPTALARHFGCIRARSEKPVNCRRCVGGELVGKHEEQHTDDSDSEDRVESKHPFYNHQTGLDICQTVLERCHLLGGLACFIVVAGFAQRRVELGQK